METFYDEKRAKQLRLATDCFIREQLMPCLDILEELHHQQIPYRIVCLSVPDTADKKTVANLFQKPLFTRYGIGRIDTDTTTLSFSKLKEHRTEKKDKDLLLYINSLLHKNDSAITLEYRKYGCTVQISLQQLVERYSAELFNQWHGEIFLAPADQSWLVKYSSEENWQLFFAEN